MDVRRRLESFNNNRWSLDFLTPLDMAIAGFTYSGTEDRVTCNNCNIILVNWKQGDNPLQKHIYHSPNCSFINSFTLTFTSRLKSFHNWPVNFLRPDNMAEAGFCYLGVKDLVKCIECKRDFCGWSQEKNPIQEHILKSPDCPFISKFVSTVDRRVMTFHNWPVNFLSADNMAVAGFYYLGIEDLVNCIECKRDFCGWSQEKNPIQEHILKSPDCPFISKFVSTVSGRVKTFHNWPVDFLRPVNMAEAGFFYLGNGDQVKCFKCLVCIDSWQLGVVPTTEHLRNSPLCSHVLRHREIFDVCGPFSSDDIQNNIQAKMIDDLLDSAGIIVKLKHVMNKYGHMASIKARLESFARCVRTFKQDINTLCEAGFFYSGNGQTDYVTCFFCTETLSEWEDADEPWIEHVKWSRTCAYVILNKGKNFVDQVLGVDNHNTECNQLELFNLIAQRENTYILGTTMKIQTLKKQINRLHSPKSLIGKNQLRLSQMLNPNSVPDCMECKICFKEEIKVIFVPCGHAVACIECALTLKQCAVCRYPFSKLIRIFLSMDKDNYEDLKLQPRGSKMSSSNKLNPMVCKTCHNEDMSAVFLPCRHVYNCIKCAEEMDECPICTENVFSFIQFFL
ncbi:putative inhibitor of apoptosis isoform X1 [Aphis gossypii]|uniref:putative inhibitor of apoptosis isoform X1 n=1 Tax=Aphis gossypii TaxID=80765 RepID=UPI0021592739|nr:putative inhibitor of apoptosis isoform X1 [Aphis gossypii]